MTYPELDHNPTGHTVTSILYPVVPYPSPGHLCACRTQHNGKPKCHKDPLRHTSHYNKMLMFPKKKNACSVGANIWGEYSVG